MSGSVVQWQIMAETGFDLVLSRSTRYIAMYMPRRLWFTALYYTSIVWDEALQLKHIVYTQRRNKRSAANLEIESFQVNTHTQTIQMGWFQPIRLMTGGRNWSTCGWTCLVRCTNNKRVVCHWSLKIILIILGSHSRLYYKIRPGR